MKRIEVLLLLSLFLQNALLQAQDESEAKRVPWTTSRVVGTPDPPPPYRLERVFPRLSFTNPVTLTNAPRTDRLFVVELAGRIVSFPNRDDVVEVDEMVDLSKTSQQADRIYGFTFDPRFPEVPDCYVCYTLGENLDNGTRVSRFRVDLQGPPRLLPDTEELLLTWRSGGHNGGCLKFGPDGYLYISTGDAGPAFPPDPLMSGQDVSNVLSTILRIDIDVSAEDLPYGIPKDNPFVGTANAREEIWAYGFRNPWRMSFDSESGDLWVGDVGWELWELVYRVEKGANYGWSIVEGPQPVHRERPRGPTPIVAPTAVHSHIEARSVTGGFVYRGSRIDELFGAYIYGDYVTGKMWTLRLDENGAAQVREIAETPIQIICFGVDNDNELYVVGYDGTIHRLMANDLSSVNTEFPEWLSETGLFESVYDHRPAAGVWEYSVNAEPWMDGAVAQRFVALPGNSSLGIQTENDPQQGILKGQWSYPQGAVLVKTISMPLTPDRTIPARRLETQLLHFHAGRWHAYSYHWNEEQTDARLASDRSSTLTIEVADPGKPGGKRRQTWNFASRTECILCHTTRGGTVYGFHPAQLNRQHDYGRGYVSQLATLQQLGIYDEAAKSEVDRIVDPYDEDENLQQRARAYLHVNCAHCHRRGGGGTAALEVEYHQKLDKTHAVGERPTQGTFGIHGARVIAPGDPFRSVLFYRVAKLGRGRMPYLGSWVIDDRGTRLLRDWIHAMDEESDPASTRNSIRLTQEQALGTIREAESLSPAVTEALDHLFATTSGALMLLDALVHMPPADVVAATAVEAGSTHSDVQIRDLFERFLPEEARVQRLGTSVDPEQILMLSGDAVRGRELFVNSAGVQCRNCHQFGEIGKKLGPELSQLAKKQTPRQILESILEPSRNIAPEFVSLLVETVDGQVHVGLPIVNDPGSELVLRDATNSEVRLPRDRIELQSPLQKSLMPEMLVQDLTAQELADLIAFLTSGQE